MVDVTSNIGYKTKIVLQLAMMNNITNKMSIKHKFSIKFIEITGEGVKYC